MPNLTLASPKRSIRTATASLMAVPTSESHPSCRLHALDALRGIAMLLGVVLHSSISYMEQRMPDLLWAVQDSSRSAVFDWLFWWLHGFRLPLFFVIAGFFSAQLYERRGAREFLRQRGKRLLVPFLAGVAIILPLTFGVWCCGWLASGSCSLENIRRMKFDPAIQDNLYGPAHLWFLEYLFLMCMMYCISRLSVSRCMTRYVNLQPPGDWRQRLLASLWGPLLLSVPAAILIGIDPTAVLSFRNSFVPEPARLAYYGLFFVVGSWLAGNQPLLERYATRGSVSIVYLLLSVPVLLVFGLLLQQYLDAGLGFPGRIALAVSGALFAWLSVFGFLGLFLHFFNREQPALRYLADASYWTYLCHLPVVGLMQVVLAQVSGPAAIKFAIVFVVAAVFGLGSYHWLVRGRWLGAVLNGTAGNRAHWLRPILAIRVFAHYQFQKDEG